MQQFLPYVITLIQPGPDNTFILQMKPTTGEIFPFLPGQFCRIQNPLYDKPNEAHLFSIASSPETKTYLEFCIKVYGLWTQKLSQAKKGDIVHVAGPLGKFIWNHIHTNAVFLAGGVGITPILSMLRWIRDKQNIGTYTLLYGNRTLGTIVYKDEIEQLTTAINSLHVSHVLSDITPNDSWSGYTGFITADILKKEVDFPSKPDFFICGPPVFTQKMNTLLHELGIDEQHIKKELF